jgi:drug/metabolite transporter (DMT)-like permease
VLGEHVGRREIGAVFAIIAGVTAIALADPQRGEDAAPGLTFLLVAGAIVVGGIIFQAAKKNANAIPEPSAPTP